MSSQPSKKRVHQDFPSVSSVTPSLSPGHAGPSIPVDGFQRSLAENHLHHGTGREFIKGCRSLVTIDTVPDLALLTIFDFYMDEEKIETWHTLVHVCRKWRNIVFGSPRRLNLRLCCRASTPVRKKLGVWPLLPIVVQRDGPEKWGVKNIIAAFEHNDRVCGIDLCWNDGVPSLQMEEVLAAMERPFPALTCLRLQHRYQSAPVVSASFLGGSAQRLQSLFLRRIPFPGLPKLLLSATHLVDLDILDIPHSAYISPQAMVTCLSVLTRLKRFRFSFESPRSRPRKKSRRPSPQTHTLFPVLTGLWYGGAHRYFEDLVAQIDVPLLNELYISFSTFDTPQIAPFISRVSKSKAHNQASVSFSDADVIIRFPRTSDGAPELEISYEGPQRQLSWTSQLCSSSLPESLISVVEHLYILTGHLPLDWEDSDAETESSRWLGLFTSIYVREMPLHSLWI